MSVKSFLKTLGVDALKVVSEATQIIPVLQPFSGLIPVVGGKVQQVEGQILTKASEFQTLFNDIQNVERVTAVVTNGAAGTGGQKAKVVAANLAPLLNDVELIGGTTIGKKFNDLSDAEKQAFNAKVAEMAGNAADLLNILNV